MSQTNNATGRIAEAGPGHGARHCHFEMGAGKIFLDLFENEFVFCDHDTGPGVSVIGITTRWSLTKVPLRLPRSII